MLLNRKCGWIRCLKRADPCSRLELDAAAPFVGNVEVPQRERSDDRRDAHVGQQELPVLARENARRHAELAFPGASEPVSGFGNEGDGDRPPGSVRLSRTPEASVSPARAATCTARERTAARSTAGSPTCARAQRGSHLARRAARAPARWRAGRRPARPPAPPAVRRSPGDRRCGRFRSPPAVLELIRACFQRPSVWSAVVSYRPSQDAGFPASDRGRILRGPPPA